MFSAFKNLLGVEELNLLSIKNQILVQIGIRKDVSIEGDRLVPMRIPHGPSAVIQLLREEWLLAPSGYRSAEKIVESTKSLTGAKIDTVRPAKGLDVIIAPNRLLAWCRQTGLTQSQLEPVLETLVRDGLLTSYEFFEGQWSDYDDPESALRFTFNPSFGDKSAIFPA